MEAKRHAYPSGRQDQYIIRLPDGMRNVIKEEAHRNFRTMNAEIVFQLSQIYRSPKEEGSVSA